MLKQPTINFSKYLLEEDTFKTLIHEVMKPESPVFIALIHFTQWTVAILADATVPAKQQEMLSCDIHQQNCRIAFFILEFFHKL